MRNTKSKMITVLLLALLAIAALPLSVNASTGNILINTTTAPSAVGTIIYAGGNVSLFFGTAGTPVTFSGAQFYLMMSQDGFAQVSTGDTRYSLTFDVSNLTAPAISRYVDTTTGYRWDVGQGWVNGSTHVQVAGGNYWIKAFDGSTTAVAVTDTYITIAGAITVTPTSGNPGQSLTISGYAFPVNYLLNLSYFNPILGQFISIVNLTAVNSLGQFTYTMPAPDLLQAGPTSTATAGDAIVGNVITFRANNATGDATNYDATYTEYARGLAQVRVTGTGGTNRVPSAGNLYGNNSDFSGGSLVLANTGVGSTIRVAGNFFYAGALTINFDGISIATSTINGTGWFNTTFTIPMTFNGQHNVTLVDGNGVVFRIIVAVGPALSLSPTSGFVGTSVTATGTGFTPPAGTSVYTVQLTWTGNANNLTLLFTRAIVNSLGQFTAVFTVPADYGGAHTVTATENVTGLTATATFTINANLTILKGGVAVDDATNPMNNTGATVTGNGTGFGNATAYLINLDNNYLGIDADGFVYATGVNGSAQGNLVFQFVDAGFSQGIAHVLSVYRINQTSVTAKVVFTIPGGSTATNDLLAQINQTTTQTNSTVNSIATDVDTVLANLAEMNATIVRIDGTVATINTKVGQIQTNLTSLGTSITSISNGMATLQTSMGQVTTSVNSLAGQIGGISSISSGVASIQTTLGSVTSSLSSINARITSVEGNTATIVSDVGNITASLSDIGATVTDISDGVATIQTDLGTLSGTVTSVEGDVATIQTSVGTVQADVSQVKTTLGTVQEDVTNSKSASESLSTLIIVAIVLALVAAIAAIASIVMMRRKIAG